MQKLVVANWKMNPVSAKEAKKLFVGTKAAVEKLKGVQVVVCPPFPFLSECAKEKQTVKVQLGVQDVAVLDSGAYTGQVSVPMVQGYKAKWVILGHSERRALGETNEIVAEKVVHALRSGLSPILCIGERERNEEGEYYIFIREELEAVFDRLKRKEISGLTIAYEPIWAIGTGKVASPEQAEEVHAFIRQELSKMFSKEVADQIRIQYGGSVKPGNAKELLGQPNIDGALVGGASLTVEDFAGIIAAA